MKKFIAIFAIIATFGFVACNNADTTADNTDSVQESIEETMPMDTMTMDTMTTTTTTTTDTAAAKKP